MQAFKLRRACVASAIVEGSEFLEVGRMAESTKGVEENDKGTEGKRGDIGARGETRNGGRKRRRRRMMMRRRKGRKGRPRERAKQPAPGNSPRPRKN